MKRLDITLSSCSECAYCELGQYDIGVDCHHPLILKEDGFCRQIKGIEKPLPNWCPLPDVDDKGEQA